MAFEGPHGAGASLFITQYMCRSSDLDFKHQRISALEISKWWHKYIILDNGNYLMEHFSKC